MWLGTIESEPEIIVSTGSGRRGLRSSGFSATKTPGG